MTPSETLGPSGRQSGSDRSIRNQFRATTLINPRLCREHYRLILAVPAFPPTEPGQFIQISCRPDEPSYYTDSEFIWPDDCTPAPQEAVGAELCGPLAVLRRPFSLASRRDTTAGVELDIIHRVVGVGTDWLSRLGPGDPVDILGPLGNRFTLPPAGGTALLVGGGVGIPPMLYLAEALGRLPGRRGIAFAGALTRDLLPLTIEPVSPLPDQSNALPAMSVAEFSRHGIPAVITTDDGSYGYRGFVTQALEKYLDGVGATPNPAPIIYTCGPEPMMKRVAQIAAARGLECQVAVERAMACGMGTCQSCCIRVRKPDRAAPPLAGLDWCYRLACTDGPVFRGSQLLW
jgi:dihydroorotate dehydrogenase electron transfer subunit